MFEFSFSRTGNGRALSLVASALTALAVLAALALAAFVDSAAAGESNDGSQPTPGSTEAGCTITGTSGNDVLDGTPGEDVICGLGGNDSVNGGGGHDVLYGGDGDDRLSGYLGPDTLDGGAGADHLRGGSGGDSLGGGAGVDRASYFHRTGPVTATIGDGPNDGAALERDDVRSDVEQLAGGGGDDRLTGTGGPNRLSGNGGDDRLTGAFGRDVLLGGDGADILYGRDRRPDRLSCGAGRDSLPRGRDPVDSLEDCEFVSEAPGWQFASVFPTSEAAPAQLELNWGSTVDPSWNCGYELLETPFGRGGGTRVPLPTPRTTSIVRDIPWNRGYYFGVATTDCPAGEGDVYYPDTLFDGTGSPAGFDDLIPKVVDGGSSNYGWVTADYAGSWTRTSEADNFAGTSLHSSTPGDSATFRTYFDEWGVGVPRVAWVATRGPDRGSARVFLDGREVGIVDLAAGDVGPRRVVWQKRVTSWDDLKEKDGAHTVRIEVISGRVDIDAVAGVRVPGDP